MSRYSGNHRVDSACMVRKGIFKLLRMVSGPRMEVAREVREEWVLSDVI